jgi:aryl-alcohol dehydrogenase-like predicted oxidoreductase
MQYRQLGRSDLHISRLGFGAWAAGGGGWAFALGPQDDRESIDAIRRAIDLGINWIDTAPLYGLGHSEEIVAKALKGDSNKPYIFTKCGMPWDRNGRIVHCLKRDSIRRECEESLRRLRTDVIDLYQIHWNKPAEDVREALETVAELREEGKVRYIGVSNFNVAELELAKRIVDPVSLQPPYSLIDRDIENAILPFCERNDIGVIVYSPMASGLLTGKMSRQRIDALPPDDLRRSKPAFREPALSRNLAIAERLRFIAARHGVSIPEIAIAWTLRQPAVTGTIVGLRRKEQVEGVMNASDIVLTNNDLAILTDTAIAAVITD